MLHKTNCTKCLIPYWLESADAIMKKVFRNFFAPRDISVVFLWSALERFLSLCLSASINVCAWILTSVCFLYVCVLSEGLSVPVRLVRSDTKAPSEECYGVSRRPRSYMCSALFQRSVTALLFSHSHKEFLSFSSRCRLHSMHNTRRAPWRNAQVRFHSKITWKKLDVIFCSLFSWHLSTSIQILIT